MVTDHAIARPTEAIATSGSSSCMPGKTTGRDVISPCSFRKVMTEPLNDTDPIRTVKTEAAKAPIRASSPAGQELDECHDRGCRRHRHR